MAIVMLVPFAWMILTAVKTNQEAISVNPFYIFPQVDWHWENFGKVWKSFVMFSFSLVFFPVFETHRKYQPKTQLLLLHN
jgi:ABC-type glycerol-3-phosphate transport system permease component